MKEWPLKYQTKISQGKRARMKDNNEHAAGTLEEKRKVRRFPGVPRRGLKNHIKR